MFGILIHDIIIIPQVKNDERQAVVWADTVFVRKKQLSKNLPAHLEWNAKQTWKGLAWFLIASAPLIANLNREGVIA